MSAIFDRDDAATEPVPQLPQEIDRKAADEAIARDRQNRIRLFGEAIQEAANKYRCGFDVEVRVVRQNDGTFTFAANPVVIPLD